MYFKDFPQTLYKFGDAESFVRFQQLNTYVNLIDQYRDDVTVYEKYIIQPGGSIRDKKIENLCLVNNICMIKTGHRMFLH